MVFLSASDLEKIFSPLELSECALRFRLQIQHIISSPLQHVMVHDIQHIHPKQSSPAGSLYWCDGRFDAAGSKMPKHCLGNTDDLFRL